MVECNDYDEYVKLKHDNEKLELKNDSLLAKCDIAERLVLSLEKQMMLCHPN